MYIHLGQDVIINKKEIVGIFDLDTSTVSKKTRDFLACAEKKGEVVNVTYELPKSFVVCEKNKKQKVYISQISSTRLKMRSGYF